MSRHAFVVVDVFTDVAFGGNQLAVFPDASVLSARAMQALAREINFAESTFVLPPDDPAHAARLRIFTPGAELPFAGHPTVGTGAALVHLGRVPRDGQGRARLVLEEGVGPVTVDVGPGPAAAGGDDEPEVLTSRLTLTSRVTPVEPAPDGRDLAAVLGLDPADVLGSWAASAGLPFSYARLSGRDAVDRAGLDRQAWDARLAGGPAPDVFLFAGDLASGSHLYARMFGPGVGVEEDAATGSACAALVGTLAVRAAADAGTTDGGGDFTLDVTQGVRLGRPSRIAATARLRDGRLEHVTVGGSVVVVGDGRMRVPGGL